MQLQVELSAQDRARLDAILERLNENDDEVLLSCSEAARHLGVTQTTVSRYVREGILHKTTIGRSTGIRLSEVKKMKTP